MRSLLMSVSWRSLVSSLPLRRFQTFARENLTAGWHRAQDGGARHPQMPLPGQDGGARHPQVPLPGQDGGARHPQVPPTASHVPRDFFKRPSHLLHSPLLSWGQNR